MTVTKQKTKPERQMKRNVMLTILMFFFVAVAAYSGYKIITIEQEYRKSEQEYSDLADDAIKGVTVLVKTETEADPVESPYLDIDHDAMYAINSDYIGWINIPDTNISYPVAESSNNQYYVQVAFSGGWSGGGAIFADYHNSRDWSDFHTILYGHLLKNKTMFWWISQYQNYDYYAARPTVEIYVKGKVYIYTVFSFFKTTATSDVYRTSFSDSADRQAYIDMLRSSAWFDSSQTVTPDDRILTLSTCTDATSDNRWVLNCVLTETIELEQPAE
jgi:sortase B